MHCKRNTLNVSKKTTQHTVLILSVMSLNFSMYNSTNTQKVLKVSTEYFRLLTLSILLSTCAVVHTEIEYIILNIACVKCFTFTVRHHVW